MKSLSIIGEVIFMRLKRTNGEGCVCCEGSHIFSRYIKVPEGKYGIHKLKNTHDYEWSWLCQKSLEGKKVKITYEVLDE